LNKQRKRERGLVGQTLIFKQYPMEDNEQSASLPSNVVEKSSVTSNVVTATEQKPSKSLKGEGILTENDVKEETASSYTKSSNTTSSVNLSKKTTESDPKKDRRSKHHQRAKKYSSTLIQVSNPAKLAKEIETKIIKCSKEKLEILSLDSLDFESVEDMLMIPVHLFSSVPQIRKVCCSNFTFFRFLIAVTATLLTYCIVLDIYKWSQQVENFTW
jgi:hypothetical protein